MDATPITGPNPSNFIWTHGGKSALVHPSGGRINVDGDPESTLMLKYLPYFKLLNQWEIREMVPKKKSSTSATTNVKIGVASFRFLSPMVHEMVVSVFAF